MILLITLTSLLITPDTNAKGRLKKVKSFLNGYRVEKTDQKELSAVSIDTISINNINGPITIKTGWKNDWLLLKTTKRAKKQTDLNNIKIAVDTSKENHLAITTKHINKKLVGLVEYELIVPASIDITLNISGSGDAYIKDVHGNIKVVTNDSITILNTKQLVSARTLKKGNISIINATGPVEARSYCGNINAHNVADSCNAHSTAGKVNVAYKILPSTSSVDLKTTSGNIMLALPNDTNAEIRGYTTRGTLMSDHYITFKPYTSQLNNLAWNKFRKEVDGTLGTGEATIALHSTNGNIKITQNKTT